MTNRNLGLGLLGCGALGLALLTLAQAYAVTSRDDRKRGVSTVPASRLEVARTWARPWRSECKYDTCRFSAVLLESLPTPKGVPHVNVVFRATFDYKTRDPVGATASLSLDDGTPPSESVRPGSFTLARSPRIFTTVTLTWIRRGLPADGRRYRLFLNVVPLTRKLVTGRKIAFTAEAWRS